MSSEDRLRTIQVDLQSGVVSVTKDPSISGSDLRQVLTFLSTVVEVVEQAFDKVYATLIEFKYLTLKEAKTGRYKKLQIKLELLVARDQYHEADNICGRLHALDSQYDLEIKPIVAGITTGEWDRIFTLVVDSEGGIINLVNETIYEIRSLFGKDLDETTIRQINSIAAQKADAIRLSLDNLRNLKNRILGESGKAGFLELTETDRETLEKEVKVFVDNSTRISAQEVVMGSKVSFGNISGSIVNVGSTLEQVTQTIGAANNVDDATRKQLTEMIGQLKTELEKVPPAIKEEAEAIAETAKALVEAGTKEKPNKAMIQITAEGLKKAAENIASVMPTVLTISGGIVKTIFQLTGIPIL